MYVSIFLIRNECRTRDSKFLREVFVTFVKSNAKALLTASPSKMQTRKRVLRSSPEWLYGSAAYPLPYIALNENCSPHHVALPPLLSFLPVFVTDTFPQKNLPVSAYVRSAIPFQYPPATHRQHHLLLLPYHVIRQTAPDSYIAVDTPSVCN